MFHVGQQVPAQLRARFDDVVGQAEDQAAAVGDSLFAFANLLASRPTVRRALTDAARTPDDREVLLRRLADGRVDAAAADLLAAAVRERWTRAEALTEAVEELGVLSHLIAARAQGQLESLEDEVFRFGQIVQNERALRSALVDRSAPAEARRQLVRRLLEGKATEQTIQLVEHAAVDRQEHRLEVELDRISVFAAWLRESRVAVVKVASPLSPEHRDRLQRALSAQIGAPVLLNIVVEPDLVGGIRVEIGDEVVDGTVHSRLEAARRQFAPGR